VHILNIQLYIQKHVTQEAMLLLCRARRHETIATGSTRIGDQTTKWRRKYDQWQNCNYFVFYLWYYVHHDVTMAECRCCSRAGRDSGRADQMAAALGTHQQQPEAARWPLAGSLGACPSGRQQRRSAPLRAQQQGARCSRGMGPGAAAPGRDDEGPGWPRHKKKTPACCKTEKLPW
jgi:hypothetical protein